MEERGGKAEKGHECAGEALDVNVLSPRCRVSILILPVLWGREPVALRFRVCPKLALRRPTDG